MSNTFGTLFRLTSFGESHGAAVGGIIDGCPAGIVVDTDFIQTELDRRRPGQSDLTTQRNEADHVEILSGIYEGHTTGQPIGFLVRNTDQRSQDYEALADFYRPSHADFTYEAKYGVRDPRGGGRSSARETLSRVVAGAFAKLFLRQHGIIVRAWTQQIGNITCNRHWEELNLDSIESNAVRCPDADTATRMQQLIQQVKAERDSLGGIVQGIIMGCPAGLGEPVFDKLQAILAHAMLSINAVKGFEYGDGFEASTQRGSQQNDAFTTDENGTVRTTTNHSGGIQGGITNGMPITFRVAFKPTATIGLEQQTINKAGEAVTLEAHGRHDPCVVPRAVPIVEAMAAITLADMLLQSRISL